ncbi:universal stress protein [Nitritalea halalkaliphila LW7]|uniref:Universal stress protein n=1 Tax=Nitritalea halalkaliphila LW7 TaxID=1189621 RepID=I5C4R4_9BACT|nr:universal stress protein [Nitritalea halalkaliphila]EIM76816.1 universal stress protein [Nitritalea halalkaliphila LW7]
MIKLVVPVDFSTFSMQAISFATPLAKKLDAKLLLLHVKSVPMHWDKLDASQRSHYAEVEAELSLAADKLEGLRKTVAEAGVQVETQLKTNSGKDKIYAFIDAEQVDLVVMGSHGNYGFKEHVLGTNTYSVLRRLQVPVLVVKEDTAESNLERICIASDLREASGPAFSRLEKILEALQVKMELLFVNTPNHFMETRDIEALAADFMKRFGQYNHTLHVIDAFKEERGIEYFVEKEGCDAVAVITSGKSDLRQYFSPSITENLIAQVSFPVLSIKG